MIDRHTDKQMIDRQTDKSSPLHVVDMIAMRSEMNFPCNIKVHITRLEVLTGKIRIFNRETIKWLRRV